MGGARIVNKAQLAKIVGRSPARISQLVAEGRLAPPAVLPDGRIRLSEALDQLAPFGLRPVADLDEDEATSNAAAGVPDSPATRPGPELAMQKARLAKLAADKAELELQRARGEFTSVAGVRKAAETIGEAVLYVLSTLGENAVTALRGAATTDEARRAWRKVQDQAQLDMIAKINQVVAKELGEPL